MPNHGAKHNQNRRHTINVEKRHVGYSWQDATVYGPSKCNTREHCSKEKRKSIVITCVVHHEGEKYAQSYLKKFIFFKNEYRKTPYLVHGTTLVFEIFLFKVVLGTKCRQKIFFEFFPRFPGDLVPVLKANSEYLKNKISIFRL